jgi:putative transcriptional regulator
MNFSSGAPVGGASDENGDFPNVAQHYLVAMPTLTDPQFGGTVVYVAEHTPKGAMGLIVNRPSDMSISTLFERIDAKTDSLPLKPLGLEDAPVFLGGPVQTDRGFVLHEPVGKWSSTMVLNDATGLTTSRDILEATAAGRGPERVFVSLGYAGWGEGQLDQELAANAWLTIPATDLSLIFDVPSEERFAYAFRILGIDPLHLSGAAGHA